MDDIDTADQFPTETSGELWEEIISGKYGDEPARDMIREVLRRDPEWFERCQECGMHHDR